MKFIITFRTVRI